MRERRAIPSQLSDPNPYSESLTWIHTAVLRRHGIDAAPGMVSFSRVQPRQYDSRHGSVGRDCQRKARLYLRSLTLRPPSLIVPSSYRRHISPTGRQRSFRLSRPSRRWVAPVSCSSGVSAQIPCGGFKPDPRVSHWAGHVEVQDCPKQRGRGSASRTRKKDEPS
jgi:hypothetical protein